MKKLRLQCPKCKSYDCYLVEEKVIQFITFTNKKGFLKNKTINAGVVDNLLYRVHCNNCKNESDGMYDHSFEIE